MEWSRQISALIMDDRSVYNHWLAVANSHIALNIHSSAFIPFPGSGCLDELDILQHSLLPLGFYIVSYVSYTRRRIPEKFWFVLQQMQHSRFEKDAKSIGSSNLTRERYGRKRRNHSPQLKIIPPLTGYQLSKRKPKKA